MAESMEHKEILHRQAMDYYNRWQADRKRRLAEYDARVEAYHAALDEARHEVEVRDRAEYAEYLQRATQLAAE